MNVKPKNKGEPYMPSYMDPKKGIEPCVVCGDAATGLHYRCMTCEGCKGFFRRSIQKNLKYACKGNGNCSVDKTSRNQCQECRFGKCISVGMASDLVLNESQRQAKKQLISENRERRRLEEIRAKVAASEGKEQLSDQDAHFIHALTAAYCAIMDTNKLERIRLTKDRELDCGSVLGPHFDRIIRFSAQILPFTKLNGHDRSALLRDSLLDVLLLQLCLQFDPATRSLHLPSRRTLSASSPELAHPHTHSLLSPLLTLGLALARLELDHKETALLTALLIFSPDQTGLEDPLSVESGQDEVLSALKRYIHEKAEEGAKRWSKILLSVVHLRTTRARVEPYISHPSNLPILAEILGAVAYAQNSAEP